MSVAMSVAVHDDSAPGRDQTGPQMIELQLTIDPTKEPVSGHVAAGSGEEPMPFIGYVELIATLERVLPRCETAPAGNRSGEAR